MSRRPSSSRTEREAWRRRPPGVKAALAAAAAAVAAAGLSGAAAGEKPRLLAWIEMESDGDHVRFTGMAEADAAVELRYELRILRLGEGGRSTTSQGGRTAIEVPGDPAQLSSVTLNIDADSAYAVELRVTGPGGAETAATIATPPMNPL